MLFPLCTFGEGNGTPLQYSCLENPMDFLQPGSLVACSPWGHEESDMNEQLHFHFSPSCIGEGNGNPLQCSCLENPRDRGAWWAAVYGVAQGWKWLKRLSSSSSIVYFCYLCQRSIKYRHIDLFLNSQFWSICLFWWYYQIFLITIL